MSSQEKLVAGYGWISHHRRPRWDVLFYRSTMAEGNGKWQAYQERDLRAHDSARCLLATGAPFIDSSSTLKHPIEARLLSVGSQAWLMIECCRVRRGSGEISRFFVLPAQWKGVLNQRI